MFARSYVLQAPGDVSQEIKKHSRGPRRMTDMAPERDLYSRYSRSKGSSYGDRSNHCSTYRRHQMPQLPQQVSQQAPQLFRSILRHSRPGELGLPCSNFLSEIQH